MANFSSCINWTLDLLNLIDVLKNKFVENDKLIWILVVIFIPFIGSLLYLFIGKNKKMKLD